MINIRSLGIALMLLIFAVIFFKGAYWLKEDPCLDKGNVWDGNEHRCRGDCLKWGEEFGCIKLTEKQTTALTNGLLIKCVKLPGERIFYLQTLTKLLQKVHDAYKLLKQVVG